MSLADGIYPTLPFADYLALDRYGSSDLKAMRAGPPAMVQWRRENPSPDTDATRLGTAAHCAILTPELFAATYIQKPAGMEYRSTENKAWRDAHLAAGRVILTADEWATVQGVSAAFRAKPVALDALDGAKGIETSVLWTCAETGLECKARPDFWQDPYTFDLKVTVHAGPGLAFQAYKNGWWHQGAHYRDALRAHGLDIKTARIVAIHPKPPHSVWCVEAREADIDVLAMENENTRKAMKACIDADEWPGTPDAFTRVEIPQYAIDSVAAALDLSGALEVDGE